MLPTAIVLSAEAVQLEHSGWTVLNHVSQFSSLEGLHEQRLAALMKVETDFCAFVDVDDELPDNSATQVAAIVGRMERAHANLTYTDWLEKSSAGQVVKRPGEYVRIKHVTNPTWMHQLVVMRTAAAQAVARSLPLGLFWTEFMLYASLCRTPPIYWPEVGYIWNKGDTGMHRHKEIIRAQVNSVHWYLHKGPK